MNMKNENINYANKITSKMVNQDYGIMKNKKIIKIEKLSNMQLLNFLQQFKN